jgi:hypothetical protein
MRVLASRRPGKIAVESKSLCVGWFRYHQVWTGLALPPHAQQKGVCQAAKRLRTLLKGQMPGAWYQGELRLSEALL